MDKTSISPLAYHQVQMTINGVTKSVLVPIPKSTCHGRPVNTKLPGGNTAVVSPNNATIKPVTQVVTQQGSACGSTVRPLRFRYTNPVTALTLPSVTNPNEVSVIRPIHRQLLRVQGSVPTVARKLTISPGSRTVTVESATGERKLVQVVAAARAPASIVRVSTADAGSKSPPRPIILRRNQKCSIVRPHIKLHSDLSVRPTYAINIQPVVNSRTSSSVPTSSLLTSVTCPRTLTKDEAIAAGWYTNDDANVKQAASDEPPARAGRMDVIVSKETADCERDIKSEPLDHILSEHELLTARADSVHGMPCTPMMKVIEIVPTSEDMDVDMSDDDEDVKPRLPVVKAESDAPQHGGDMVDDEYRSSSASTVTAPSDGEYPATATGSSADDFVVLAEWTKDDADIVSPDIETAKLRTKPTRRRARCNPYKRRKRNWFTYKRSPPSRVAKARRTGGRPRTAAERHGIVDCFVSLPVLRLHACRRSADVRNCWRYMCCWRKQIQRCRCSNLCTPRNARRSASNITKTEVKVRELFESAPPRLVQPSMVVARSSLTLPVEVSGPTSDDGVTPLLVRQPDGKLSSVVAKRTNPDESSKDASRRKYLLIKAKTGSYLVPVDTTSNAVPPVKCTSPPPAPEEDVKPFLAALSDGKRERIERLKQQLHQQEKQLDNIRSRLNRPH